MVQLQLMEADRMEEEDCFVSMDKLMSQGINAEDVKKLQDVGISTCNDLMMHTKKSLTGIKGLSEAKVEKICEAAEKLLSQGFMTGSDLLTKSQGLKTGSDLLIKSATESQAIPARYVAPTSGGQSWGLLNRVIFFVDDPEGDDPEGVDYCIIPGGVTGLGHEKIREVSVVLMNGYPFGSSSRPATGIVKCTDPAGNILIEVSQGQGTERFFVCRPRNAKALCLPLVPGSLGVQNSSPCAGIASDPCGGTEDFVVAYLQQASPASSGSPNLLQVLCFASSEDMWRLKNLRAYQLSHFEPSSVISHRDGSLVFIDLDHGMLFFDPRNVEAVKVIQFPGGSEYAEKVHRCIASTEGHLWHGLIQDVQYEPKVTMWCLDQKGEWQEKLCIFMDEIWASKGYTDAGLPAKVPRLLFMNPFNPKSLFFTLGNSMFSIEVLEPPRLVLHELACEVFNNCSSSPENLYPLVFADPYQCPIGSPIWQKVFKSTETGKRLAKLAWRTLKDNHKILDKAPMAAEILWLVA